MALWMDSLRFLDRFLEFLSSKLGLGEGLAIVALTLLVRALILPIWPNAPIA